jgi:hypothetical protein
MEKLAMKSELFQLNSDYVNFLENSKAVYIEFVSFLPNNPIKMLIIIDELKHESPLGFLYKNREFCKQTLSCDNCDAMLTDDDVITQAVFLFENVDSSKQIQIFFTTKNEYPRNENLDILQASISIGTHHIFGSQRGLRACQTLEFSFVNFGNEFPNMMNVFALETEGFTFVFDDWSTLFYNIIDLSSTNFLRKLVDWNTNVKLHPKTNVKMLLLTLPIVHDAKTADIGNVKWVIFPNDARYIWKIYWDKIPRGTDVYSLKQSSSDIGDDTPVAMLANSTQFEEKFLSAPIPSTCIDIVNAEIEQSVEDFIRKDSDNLVFLFPLDHNTRMAGACYSRFDLHNARVFYECKTDKTAIVNTSYFRLDVRDFPIFIQDDNYMYLLESTSQFFIVNETPRILNLTISEDVLFHRSDWLSADHCQLGTEKHIFAVFPVAEKSLVDAVSFA